MKTNIYIYIANLTALISFSVGTLLLMGLLITEFEGFLVIGTYYLVLAIAFNVTLLILIRIILIKEERFEIFKSILLMLINIPIAYLYTQIIL